jgi:hypothetical protein
MKNEYSNPTLEISELNSDDVIATSTVGGDTNGDIDPLNPSNDWWNN